MKMFLLLVLPVLLAAADGRALFVARCASCDNERGDKPLKEGPPLNQRPLTRKQVEGFVKSRLAKAGKAEQRAVTDYILGFLEAPK